MNLLNSYFNKLFSQGSSAPLATLSNIRGLSTDPKGPRITLAFVIFSFLLLSCPDAFASLAQPFTTKLGVLSGQLVIFGKALVGVSVLIGILSSVFGEPKWKIIITGIVVGIAIIGFAQIKSFIGLSGF